MPSSRASSSSQKPNSGPTYSMAASAATFPSPSSTPASPTAPGRATGASASFWRPLLSRLSRVLAQSQTDADRLLALGCVPDQRLRCRQSQVRCACRSGIRSHALAEVRCPPVCASSLPAARLKARNPRSLKHGPASWPTDPQLVLVLAPRHPERFSAVATLLEKSGVLWTRRSSWTAGSSAAATRISLAPAR